MTGRDTFPDEFEERLRPAGWVIVDAHRYDPTTINGVTPAGELFQFSITRTQPILGSDVLISLAVDGAFHSVTKEESWMLDGQLVADAIIELYESMN